ncbi:hypothetical protein L204_100108 [Cryptococcus depauperatus]
MFDPHSVASKRRASVSQDFQAVIIVGYGQNLYPFNQGTNVISKALIPVGNIPIINYVIDWVLAAGLLDILIIVPNVFHGQIANHIAEAYNKSSYSRIRINLRRNTEGERDEDENDSEKDLSQKDGTARILRRFRNFIKSDFLLLPCDIAPPSYLPLKAVLDRHRSTPNAIMTSVFYEPIDSVKEVEEHILVGLDKNTSELLLITPLDSMDEEDFQIRTSLLTNHPSLSLTTRLLDAHVYVFRRTFLDLLATRRAKDLDSMKEQVVPWLIKGGWQRSLGQKWAPILDPPGRDPLAQALAQSTNAPPSLSLPNGISSPFSQQALLPQTCPPSPGEVDTLYGSGILSPIRPTKGKLPKWKCQIIVAAPPSLPAVPTPAQSKGSKQDKSNVQYSPESEHLVRANSLAGYWELNRRFIKTLATNSQPARVVIPEDAGTAPDVSSAAQISPDSHLGEGTRVGEKASIKKCIIGRHCVIGKGVKLTGCVIWDFVTVEENARIENSIVCSNGRIGEKAQIKDCEFGTGFEALSGAVLKGERLIAGQEV